MTDPTRTRIVCGVRATGRLHFGNYLGAVRTMATRAALADHDAFFFIADLHTLTTLREPDVLRRNVLDTAIDCIAAGIDPEHTSVYVQSSVPETSELAWLLSSVTYLGELERVPNFKERERQRGEGEPLNAGLLNYPLLMAADILGPRAHRVMMGEDQYPHLELVRDIARRFNRRFFPSAGFFPEPVPASDEPLRIPGLDGAGKMGNRQGNTLPLFDAPEVRWSKLEAAVTDPSRTTMSMPGTPERCGIYAIHQLVEAQGTVNEIGALCRSAKLACMDCKRRLDTVLGAIAEPIQIRRREIAARPERVREALHEGVRRVRTIVSETRNVVQDQVGIERY